MNDEEALVHIVELINTFEGLEVFETDIHEKRIYIDFRARSLSSLAHIAWSADKSNVQLSVEAFAFQGTYGEKIDPNKDLQFILRIPENESIDSPPTKLQEFGIFLLRDLKAQRLISESHANELLTDWNATIY